MFRSRLALAVAVIVGLALVAGLGGSWAGSATKVKVGFIMEARPALQPWSAAIHDAGVRLQQRDKNVSITETFQAFNPTAAEPVARQLLKGGFGVLVFHSFALNDVAHKLAKEFPKTPMSVSSFSPPVQKNLSIATASYLEIGYADCWLLAKLSKSNKIGFIGAQPIPYAVELLKGCTLGAAAANSKVKVLSAYSNSFSDAQATQIQAKNLVSRGADGLFPASATEDSLGGFQVCEQSTLNCAGWAAASTRYAPKTGVTSIIVDWSVLLSSLVGQARSGKLNATTFDATFENHGLLAQPFAGAGAARVPAAVRTEFAGVIKQLTKGAIKLPKSKAHPCCP